MSTLPLLKRDDTAGLLEWYLNLAYIRQSEERGLKGLTKPRDDLKLMLKYWAVFQNGQDSILMCLEIQQRLLYEELKVKLYKDVDYLESFVPQLERSKFTKSAAALSKLCRDVVMELDTDAAKDGSNV